MNVILMPKKKEKNREKVENTGKLENFDRSATLK